MEAFLYIEQLLLVLTVIISIGYLFLIANIYSNWVKTKEWKTLSSYKPSTEISVIVAARNESAHIKRCIESILDNTYDTSLFEIIVIDDHSTDNTSNILKNITSDNLTILQANGKGKKEAISQGIKASSGQLILCTDADCTVGKKWLQTYSSYYEHHKARLITGPIRYNCRNSSIHFFQYLDGINNMAVTASGIYSEKYQMANGANMAFEKSLFEEINGFENNAHLASGDDMFLAQEAAKRDISNIGFLKSKDAIVNTEPENNWSDLLKQRKRWATKTTEYSSKRIALIQGYVFAFTLLILLNLTLLLCGKHTFAYSLITALSIKWIVDFIYLYRLSHFFGNKKPLKAFFSCSLLFLVYIVIAGYWALFPSKYEWKERKTR